MNEEETAPPPQGNAAGPPRPSAEVAPEIARRVGSILDAVEREAARLREEARAEAGHYLEQSRLRADALIEARRRRIAELSDELIVKSEAVVGRLDDAAPVRQGFENLVRALADAAERLAREKGDSARDFRPPPFFGSPDAGGAGPPPAAAYPPPPPPVPAPARYPVHAPYPVEASDPSAYGYAPVPEPAPPVQPPSERDLQPQQQVPASPPGGYDDAPDVPGQGGWRELDDARAVARQMASHGATRGVTREHLQSTLGLAFYTGGILDEVFGMGSGDDTRVP